MNVLQELREQRKNARLYVLRTIYEAWDNGECGVRLNGREEQGFAIDLLEQGLVSYDIDANRWNIFAPIAAKIMLDVG